MKSIATIRYSTFITAAMVAASTCHASVPVTSIASTSLSLTASSRVSARKLPKWVGTAIKDALGALEGAGAGASLGPGGIIGGAVIGGIAGSMALEVKQLSGENPGVIPDRNNPFDASVGAMHNAIMLDCINRWPCVLPTINWRTCMGPWVLADATKHGVNVSKFKVDFVANIASSIASIDKDPIGNFQSRVQAILPKSSLPGFGVLVRSISNASTSGDVDKAIAVEVRRALSDRGFTETNRNSYLCCLAVFHYSNNLWSKNSQK